MVGVVESGVCEGVVKGDSGGDMPEVEDDLLE